MTKDELLQDAILCLNLIIDTDDCRLDHNGNCQQHNWFGKEECPHKMGKRILKAACTFIPPDSPICTCKEIDAFPISRYEESPDCPLHGWRWKESHKNTSQKATP